MGKSSGGIRNAKVKYNPTEDARKWNEDVVQQEKRDKNITKLEKELKNVNSLIELSVNDIQRFDKIGNTAAKNDEIERVKLLRTIYDKAKSKLELALKNNRNTPKLVRRETGKNTWESAADSFAKNKRTTTNLSFDQNRTIEKHKKIIEAINYWKKNKSTSEAERIKNIKYFTNQKLINLQEIKRQFKLKDLR